MARRRKQNAGIASREAGKPPGGVRGPATRRRRAARGFQTAIGQGVDAFAQGVDRQVGRVLVEADREKRRKAELADKRARARYRADVRTARQLGLPKPPPPELPSIAATRRGERQQVRAIDKTHRYDTRRPRGGLLGALAGNPLELKGSLGERFTRGGISFALGLPAFAFEAGQASGKDVRNQAILGYKSIREPGKHHEAPPLESLKLLKGMGQATKQTVRHPLRDPFNALLLGSAAYGGAATGFSRASAFDAARAEGASVRKAATRPGHEGGGLLHTPIPRETTLTKGGKTVKRLEPDQPGLRPLHRRRTRKLQAELDQPPVEPTWREALAGKKGGVPGKAAQVARRKLQLTAEDVFGREWRAMRRIEPTVANAYAAALARETANLTPVEKTAMRIALISPRAALRNPDLVVSRHVETHAGFAAEGIRPDMHGAIAEQAAKAADVLRNPSKEFLRATARARQLSRRMTAEAVRRRDITPESARRSVATMAEAYGLPVERGAAYFPSGEPFITMGKPQGARTFSPRPGQVGLGPVEKGRGYQGTRKHRTGKGIQQGVVEDVPAALLSAHHGRQVGYQAKDLYREALRASTAVKTHPDQIGVRSTRKITQAHRREIARAAREGDEDAIAAALDRMTRDTIVEGSDGAPVGRQIPGVRWIDRRIIKDIREAGVTQGRAMKVVRGVNAPVRFAQVYARPIAYFAQNYPQNYIMGAYLHGPRAVAKAMKAARKDRGTLLGDITEQAMGTARTESYRIGAGRKGKLAEAGQRYTERLTSATDRDFRGAMWKTRARERGYLTDADQVRLATDPKLRDDYIAVTRRARKDAVDFDSLTPDERQAAEFIYFYPWTSRSTAWAARTIANRPVRTAVIAQGAKVAHEKEEQRLGPHPSWMAGMLKTRWGLINPIYAAPFGTQAELAQTARDVAKGRKSPAEAVGTPFLEIAGSAGTEPGGFKTILGQTAPGGALRRAGINPGGIFGRPSKTFPQTGVGPALGPLLGGGFYPRKPDKEAQRKATLMDATGVERVKARHADYAAQYLDILKQAGLAKPSEKKLRAPTQKAIDLRESRFAFRASLNADTLEKKYEADVLWLASQGHGTPEQAQAEIRWARKIPEQRKYLIRQRSQEVLGPIFADMYGDTIHDLRELVRERGYDLPQLR